MAVQMATLPRAFSNKREAEQLRADAAVSLLRMSLRMVPGADANFSIWSALRTRAEQTALFRENYRYTGRAYKKFPGDRWYDGTVWRHVTNVAVASPDLGSNHEDGVAIDIHGGEIQDWIIANGRRFGWDWAEGRRNGERWHFRYFPQLDRYKGQGVPDIAGMQAKLGVTADGKVGLGTVAAVQAFQANAGLRVDGIAGPATQAAILGTATPAREPAAGTELTAASSLEIDRSVSSPNHYDGRAGREITEITIHWWGAPAGQAHDGIVDHLSNPNSEASAHYVVSPGEVSQLVDEADGSWANGDKDANYEAVTVECDPNDILGTLATLAALIADIWSRHGQLQLVPHQAHVATECCGDYIPLLDDLAELAAGATVDVTLTGSAASPGTVDEDGRWGRETTAELQGRLGVKVDGMAGPATLTALARRLDAPFVDGIISRQPKAALDLGNGYRRDCIEVGDGHSQLVMLWQAYVGATVDGRLGEETIERTQATLNASKDAFTAAAAGTIAHRVEGVLVSEPIDEDGIFGPATASLFQAWVGVVQDGAAGHDTWEGLQRLVDAEHVDGEISRQSHRAATIGAAITQGWEYTGPDSTGSPAVEAMQKIIGARPDGIWGRKTTLTLQKALNEWKARR